MAIFGKDVGARAEGRGAAAEPALSIIAAGMHITGDIETSGVVKIDGRVDGSVMGARQILLGRGGAIHGNVSADEVVIGGEVFGAVSASQRLELQGTAVVNGDVDTKSIVVLEGAQINGSVRMAELLPQKRPSTDSSSISIATR